MGQDLPTPARRSGESLTPAVASARERFVREALAVGRLRHRDLVEVFGAGQARGHGWVAMELVPGAILIRYARPARLLPPGVVVAIGRRVAKALAFAHRAVVVHRDVKPENIIVDWSTDSVKLVDFGLAHWSDQARTTSGQMLGSPDCMSPELPLALCQAVMALLAKVPARRTADAQGMADRLAALATQPGRP